MKSSGFPHAGFDRDSAFMPFNKSKPPLNDNSTKIGERGHNVKN